MSLRIRSFVVAAVVSLGAVVALAAPGGGSGAGSGAPPADGSGGGGKWKPPQAAFDACAKAKADDACTFKGRGGRDLKGKCETPKNPANGKALVCRVQRGGGGGDGDGGGGGAGGGAGSGSGAGKGSGSGAKH